MTTAAGTTVTVSGTYPRKLSFKGGKSVQVRPMTYEDADALHHFFCAIPEEDLLFLRRDVTDRDVIEAWAQDVALGRTFTLLAERNGELVGEASIHRSQVPWTSHVGEIRVVVGASDRAHGLGTALVISTNTVAHHITSIFNKSGAANRTEAAAYALRRGLVS